MGGEKTTCENRTSLKRRRAMGGTDGGGRERQSI